MSPRLLASAGVLASVITAVSLAPIPIAGQTSFALFARVAEASGEEAQVQTATGDPGTPPRTPWGVPDLRGIWDYRTLTPLQRPEELAGKEFLTDEEAAEFKETRFELLGGRANAISGDWWDFEAELIADKRTSLIVDPLDGRIPPFTPEAREQLEAHEEAHSKHPADSWEDQRLADRCILGYTAGPPILPVFPVNNNVQIFQTPRYVALLNEMIHDVRIVPLDGRPHIGEDIRQWHGDSRGRWDGDTLVVDTTNFTDLSHFWWGGHSAWRASRPTLHLVERFTRVDAATLLYEFTVDDPATWTKPWSGAVPMRKSEGPIFEYACHEGNYDLPSILRLGRFQEKAAEEAAKKGSR